MLAMTTAGAYGEEKLTLSNHHVKNRKKKKKSYLSVPSAVSAVCKAARLRLNKASGSFIF
jgi:hypothetical protein